MKLEDLENEVQKLIKNTVMYCYQCGKCSGSCPTTKVCPSYNPRRIAESLILGRWKEVLSSNEIWLCTLCHTCYENCPQNVGFSHVIIELRNIAARAGAAPDEFLSRVRQLAEVGRIAVISKAIERRRSELSLPELQASPDGIPRIMEATGLKLREG
ncbi:MAG: hypothetical protein DRN99_00185 [Thermoproteota archaeon]|nr:MAG: hypothetical protein DRN99_00185 [Candidatus Korarchaeota archaeon]